MSQKRDLIDQRHYDLKKREEKLEEVKLREATVNEQFIEAKKSAKAVADEV